MGLGNHGSYGTIKGAYVKKMLINCNFLLRFIIELCFPQSESTDSCCAILNYDFGFFLVV